MNPSPKPLRLAPAALVALAALILTGAVARAETRRIEQTFFAGNARSVEVDLTIGSLSIEGTDGRDAEVHLILTCDRADAELCERRANRIRLVPRLSGDHLSFRLKNTPRGLAGGIGAEMRLKIPRRLALEVDIAGGDVFITGMRHHIEVDSAGGDIDIGGVPQSGLQSVKVDVGIGKADLWLRDGHIKGSGFPRSITWRGSGSARIELDLGAGNANVRLE